MRRRNFLAGILGALAALFGVGGVRAQDNPGIVEVLDLRSYSRVVAVSDVHGMYDNTRRLLRAGHLTDLQDKWVGGNTLLVVCGDSIDKGPNSLGILRLWMRLEGEARAQGGRVLVLLGNHEAEFLSNPDSKKALKTREAATAHGMTAGDMSGADKPIGRYLRSLPLAARVGDWLFCHAGWLPPLSWQTFTAQAKDLLNRGDYANAFITGPDSILEKKAGGGEKKWWHSASEITELERRLDTAGLVGVVFGHQPGGLDIVDNVGRTPDGRIIKVDSGMAPDGKGQPYPGHLLVLPDPLDLQKGRLPRPLSVAASGATTPAPVAP